ncbi:MAG: ribonucleotide reductase N-terminal alpha domain-containing protein, partial [Chloroflexaceae bacterium]
MDDLARTLWEVKYRQVGERSIEDSWSRVATALASCEAHDRDGWAARFQAILADYRFLPGGRILAGAGTARKVTLFNCFVMGVIEDSMDGIFQALKEGALTMQQGGGVGYDFSTLRPIGSQTHSAAGMATGPLSFMHVWDAMCATVLSQGARRGAMIATLRCDHPDIEAFIDAKREAGVLRHFNLSVQVSDDFLRAVEADADWALVFPTDQLADAPGETILRRWTGSLGPVPCRVFRRVPARALWQRLMRAAYDTAEPGVLFIDRINALNNLGWREQISATNPCGEVPLPPMAPATSVRSTSPVSCASPSPNRPISTWTRWRRWSRWRCAYSTTSSTSPAIPLKRSANRPKAAVASALASPASVRPSSCSAYAMTARP